MALIKVAERQQTSVCGHLTAREICLNELMKIEGKGQLCYNIVYQAMDAPKGMLGI